MQTYFDRIYREDKYSFRQSLLTAFIEGEKRFIITANPETFMAGLRDPAFDTVLKSPETTVVPDGIGIVKGANALGISIKERITGVETASFLLQEAARLNKTVFLYGAKEEVIAALQEKLMTEYPGFRFGGIYNGYDEDEDVVMERAVQVQPDLLLVALGVPRQELLISRFYPRLQKAVCLGVDDSFDVLSGAKNRHLLFLSVSIWNGCTA